MERPYKRKVTTHKETVHVIPLEEKGEFRFSIVEVDGKRTGDMRYFEKGRHEDIMLPTKRGIPFPEDANAFLEGFEKLRKKFQVA